MRRVVVAVAIAAAWLLAPISAYSDTDLTALVAAAYFPRTESLHVLAHERAQYQVTYSGGICSSSGLTHDGLTTAEVLACNYVGPAHAVEQWIGSPAHHAILSDPTYTDIGCASAFGAGGAIFFACVLVAGEPVEVARTPNPTPVGATPTAGASPALLPDTALCDKRPDHWKCQPPTATPTATPAPTIAPTPAPTPTPVPTATAVPTNCSRYLSPTGNDTNPGTFSAPWRTILYASAQLAPGDVLCARGGTYTGQGGYNWKSSGTTIRAYPGESPVFDGAGWSHGIIVSGYTSVTIDGLTFTGYGMGPTGDAAVLLLNARGITIRNSTFLNNGVGFQQDHHIYVNSGCADVLIEGNFMDGTPGAAVHIYHDPGPTNVDIIGNTMRNGYWGVVIGSNANDVLISGNTFSGNVIDIDNQRGTNVRIQ